MYRTLYKYRLVDVVSDDDKTETDTEENTKSLGIPIQSKFLFFYLASLVIASLSFPFAPSGSEVIGAVFVLSLFSSVLQSAMWGMIVLIGVGKFLKELNRNYFPV